MVREWKTEVLGTWVEHDDISCKALKEYDETVDTVYGISPYKYMEKIAVKHGTTISNMKEHWKCIRDER